MQKFYSKLLFLGLLCFPGLAFCQLTRGCYIVDGSANFSFSSEKSTPSYSGGKGFSAQISPTISYFLVDRLAVGLSLGGSFSFDDNSQNTSVSAGPRVRYYFKDRRPVSFFAEAAANYGKSRYSYTNSTTGTEMTTDFDFRSFRAGAGMSYFLNPNVALEMNLNWVNSDSGLNNFPVINFLQLGFGFAMFLGSEAEVEN